MVDIEELRRLIEPEIVAECSTDIYGDLHGEDRATDAILVHVQAKYRPVIEELSRLREREKSLVEGLRPFAESAVDYDNDDTGEPDLKWAPDASSIDSLCGATIGDLRRARALIKDTPDVE